MNSSTENNSGGNGHNGAPCEFDMNLGVLREIPLFFKMPSDMLRALALQCRRERYAAGERIFAQGDAEDTAYVILEGSGRVVRRDDQKEIDAGNAERGALLCSLSLLGKVERLFSVEAREDTLCLLIPGDKIRADLFRSEEFGQSFLRGLAEGVVQWEKNVLERIRRGVHGGNDSGVSLL